MNRSRKVAIIYVVRKISIIFVISLLLQPILLMENVQLAGAIDSDATISFSSPLDVTTSEDVIESEPSIAISPTSPTTFLAGMNSTQGLMAVRLSVDEGKNWFDATLPPFAGPSQADPVVGFDGDGKAYISGISANVSCIPGGFRVNPDQPGGVFVASGTVNPGSPPSITWNNTVIVESNVPGDLTEEVGDTGVLQDKPWLAIDKSPSSPFKNRVYIAWTSFYGNGDTIIWFAHSPGFGQPFSLLSHGNPLYLSGSIKKKGVQFQFL